MTTALAPRILLVEDERDIAEAIRMNLDAEGFEVVVIGDGTRALEVAQVGGFDLVVLDVMLPGLDGLTFCRRLREIDPDTPILFLSALGQTDDRVRGLKAGGDDYLGKPFDLRELLLRVEALLKRRERAAQPVYGRGVLRLGSRRIDLKSGEVTAPDGVHRLTGKEFEILRYLAERRGQIVRRGELLDRVWGPQADPTERTVDNFIVKLRRMLEDDPADPRWLHTHRGLGYRLAVVPEPGPERDPSPPVSETPSREGR
jgi:two-component system alkaline phosphatase synthesis response regulator PhoP